MAIQQLMLGVGAKKKTYIDDVFSSFLYEGTGSARSINNGINLSSKGGMVWNKTRTGTHYHMITDTVRGATKAIYANDTAIEQTDNTKLTSFNSNGFSLGSDTDGNASGQDFASWSFRKEPGFFDVVTWTGNGANRTIAHSLGCVPGLIMIKCTTATRNWQVYHRGSGNTHALKLNETDGKDSSSYYWNNTDPTSTHFTVGIAYDANKTDESYVAYLFAGGESTAATAKSVDFDGSGDYLNIATTADFAFGTGDFTIEFWQKLDSTSNSPHQLDFRVDGSDSGTTNSLVIYVWGNDNKLHFWVNGSNRISSIDTIPIGQWQHVALVRSSSTTTLYINGTSQGTYSDSTDYGSSTSNSNPLVIGQRQGNYASNSCDGEISNLRIVKGTAVYTSSFRPPTEPLTNITNTKLLCCNNSSTTGSTVTPGTITANGDPTASTDSPFDDPAAFKFGENGDQRIIKTGSYSGNGANDGPEVYVGFEPQWLLLKNSSISDTWYLYDCMRGIVSGGGEPYLQANDHSVEVDGGDKIDLTSTGFKITNNNADLNGDGNTIIYLAICRPDGYCGKPADAGTDVFALDTGSGTSTLPVFDSTFPVDYAWYKNPSTTSSGFLHAARLMQGKYLNSSSNAQETTFDNFKFDSNVGWNQDSVTSAWQSWMWKRHAGFDVVCWEGDGNTSKVIPHSLSKIPEMIWTKNRDDSDNWICYHKGLNGGTNPWTKFVKLNETSAEATDSANWNDTAPTATAFTVGNADNLNYNGHKVIAMLFASVDGISKVGSYTGNGSTGQTIDVGFAPRFILIKGAERVTNWGVWDTTRGLTTTASNNYQLFLNTNDDQELGNQGLVSTSSGFTLNNLYWNDSSEIFIYYAHA